MKRVRKTIDTAAQAAWLKCQKVSNVKLVDLLTIELHSGEAAAIALAVEIKAERLLIDEREGRIMARQLGQPLTGVLGILLRAKRLGQIKSVLPEISALRTRARFFIDAKLESEILKSAGE